MPRDLAAVFSAHAPAAVRGAGIGAALASLVERGRRAWPEHQVGAEQIVRWAAERFQGGGDVAKAIEALHAEDLYLACACSLRLRPALDAFERTCLRAGALRAALVRIDPSPAFADEVLQAVREKLFVGKPGKAPRISEYSGRGALAGWVRVVAMRTALDLRPAHAAVPEPEGAHELRAVSTEPELRILKKKYGTPFQEALTAAFAALDDEQCNLLKLQVVDGLRTAQIASLFRVDRSTIKRRLAACREALLAETRRQLETRHGVGSDEFQSLADLIQSQLHISMTRLLKRG